MVRRVSGYQFFGIRKCMKQDVDFSFKLSQGDECDAVLRTGTLKSDNSGVISSSATGSPMSVSRVIRLTCADLSESPGMTAFRISLFEQDSLKE